MDEIPGVEEQAPPGQFGERGLGDILNETFVIYGRHFKKFVVLAAVIHLPVALLALIPVDHWAVGIILNIISFIVVTFAYAAAIVAVGQHYVANRVSVGGCYARVLWRGKSITLLAAMQAVLLAGFLVTANLVIETEQAFLIPVVILLLVGLLLFLIYMTTLAPAVMVEGYRSMAAIRRGIALARTAELRILGYVVAYSLVALGLAIVSSYRSWWSRRLRPWKAKRPCPVVLPYWRD